MTVGGDHFHSYRANRIKQVAEVLLTVPPYVVLKLKWPLPWKQEPFCVCVCASVITSAAGEAVGAVCTAVTPESHHAGQTHTLSAHLVAAAVAGALCGALTGYNNNDNNSSGYRSDPSAASQTSRRLAEEKPDANVILPPTCAAGVTVVTGGTLVT